MNIKKEELRERMTKVVRDIRNLHGLLSYESFLIYFRGIDEKFVNIILELQNIQRGVYSLDEEDES